MCHAKQISENPEIPLQIFLTSVEAGQENDHLQLPAVEET